LGLAFCSHSGLNCTKLITGDYFQGRAMETPEFRLSGSVIGMKVRETDMMRKTVIAAWIILVCFTAGCARSRLSSFQDPAFTGKAFQKLLVMATISDMKLRNEMEQAFAERLTRSSTMAVPSATILVPDHKYSEAELSNLLHRYNIDGVLLITLVDKYQERIDITNYANCSSAMVSANAAMLNNQTCDISGYALRLTADCKIRLYDVASNQTAWEATSSTQGTSLAGFKILANSLAEKTVKELSEAGLIR
jgi:hypothetical protein